MPRNSVRDLYRHTSYVDKYIPDCLWVICLQRARAVVADLINSCATFAGAPSLPQSCGLTRASRHCLLLDKKTRLLQVLTWATILKVGTEILEGEQNDQ